MENLTWRYLWVIAIMVGIIAGSMTILANYDKLPPTTLPFMYYLVGACLVVGVIGILFDLKPWRYAFHPVDGDLVWIDGLLDSLKELREAAEVKKEHPEDPETSRRFTEACEAFHKNGIAVDVGTIRLEKVGCERESHSIRFMYEFLDMNLSALSAVSTIVGNTGGLEQTLLKARTMVCSLKKLA